MAKKNEEEKDIFSSLDGQSEFEKKSLDFYESSMEANKTIKEYKKILADYLKVADERFKYQKAFNNELRTALKRDGNIVKGFDASLQKRLGDSFRPMTLFLANTSQLFNNLNNYFLKKGQQPEIEEKPKQLGPSAPDETLHKKIDGLNSSIKDTTKSLDEIKVLMLDSNTTLKDFVTTQLELNKKLTDALDTANNPPETETSVEEKLKGGDSTLVKAVNRLIEKIDGLGKENPNKIYSDENKKKSIDKSSLVGNVIEMFKGGAGKLVGIAKGVFGGLLSTAALLGGVYLIYSSLTDDGPLKGIKLVIAQIMNVPKLISNFGRKMVDSLYLASKNVFATLAKAPVGTAAQGAIKSMGSVITGGLRNVAMFVGKSLKMLPIIGNLISLGSAISRWKSGDITGALIDGGAAIAGFVDLVAPGAGRAISIGLSLWNAKRDLMGDSAKARETTKFGKMLDAKVESGEITKEEREKQLEEFKKKPIEEMKNITMTPAEKEEKQAEEVAKKEETMAEYDNRLFKEDQAQAIGESETQAQMFERERQIAEKARTDTGKSELKETNQKLDKVATLLEEGASKETKANNNLINTNSNSNTINYINNTDRDVAYFERNKFRHSFMDYKYGY